MLAALLGGASEPVRYAMPQSSADLAVSALASSCASGAGHGVVLPTHHAQALLLVSSHGARLADGRCMCFLDLSLASWLTSVEKAMLAKPYSIPALCKT